MTVEDNQCVYKGKDSFLQLPTSFGKSVRYEVLLFACLTVNKVSWVQDRVASCCLVSLIVRSLMIAKFMGQS